MITRTSTILLQRLKDRGDDAIWREFDTRYRPVLLAVGRRLGLGLADAEDAAQETLVAFLAEYKEGRYRREMGRLRDWLAGIMTHKVQDLRGDRAGRSRHSVTRPRTGSSRQMPPI
jgi:DNA-directed RNA polymerase specialized sigma24 family protein